MNDKIRKALPVVGALALTSSALLAGTGAALAKEPPTAVIDSTHSGCSQSGVLSYYDARFDLDINKGRWVYLSGELVVDDEVEDTLPWGKYDKKVDIEMTAALVADVAPATAYLHLGDRKGEKVTLDWTICP